MTLPLEQVLPQRPSPRRTSWGDATRARDLFVSEGCSRLPGRCYGLGMSMEDVPFAFGCSPTECRVVSLIDMLKIRRQRQPMLPKHVAVQMLAERSLDHSRLHRVDAVGFAGEDFAGLHVGVHDELLLGLAVRVPEAVKALVGHAHKLGMLLLLLLLGCQFLLGPIGLLICPVGQRSGINRPVTLGPRGQEKE